MFHYLTNNLAVITNSNSDRYQEKLDGVQDCGYSSSVQIWINFKLNISWIAQPWQGLLQYFSIYKSNLYQIAYSKT